MLAYINDRPVEFNEGETILAAAKRVGIFIPTLCALLPIDHTPGTCRVCLVEIRDGASSRITTACTTPIAEGMHVYTYRHGPGYAKAAGQMAFFRPRPKLRRLSETRRLRIAGCGRLCRPHAKSR